MGVMSCEFERRYPRVVGLGMVGRVLATLLACSFISACISRDAKPAPTSSSAESELQQLESACINLLRQVRVVCHDGLKSGSQETRAKNQFDCLDARLKLNNRCF